ncbi:hypothetical protein ACIRU3_42915 [Streptomyces sp. NPDC101151]
MRSCRAHDPARCAALGDDADVALGEGVDASDESLIKEDMHD